MSIPKLKKIKSEKKYHDLTLTDEYAWVDQPNILEVLKDANKLDPEVKDYISANNKITEDYFKDVKDLQKNLFQEIKSKIKLDDTSLKFKDKKYYYWAKTEAKGNYGKRIRQLIDGSKPEEVYFDGDLEKKNYGSEYFGVGSVSTSHCDNYMAYSLDLKGSEYYTIYLRDLRTGKNENYIIENTSGGITCALDRKSNKLMLGYQESLNNSEAFFYDDFESTIIKFKDIHNGPILIAHSDIKVANQAVMIAKKNYGGIVGVYPNNCFFKKPNWNVIESISPKDYLEEAQQWVDNGAQIVGGCCGISPNHIKALSNLKN